MNDITMSHTFQLSRTKQHLNESANTVDIHDTLSTSRKHDKTRSRSKHVTGTSRLVIIMMSLKDNTPL